MTSAAREVKEKAEMERIKLLDANDPMRQRTCKDFLTCVSEASEIDGTAKKFGTAPSLARQKTTQLVTSNTFHPTPADAPGALAVPLNPEEMGAAVSGLGKLAKKTFVTSFADGLKSFGGRPKIEQQFNDYGELATLGEASGGGGGGDDDAPMTPSKGATPGERQSAATSNARLESRIDELDGKMIGLASVCERLMMSVEALDAKLSTGASPRLRTAFAPGGGGGALVPLGNAARARKRTGPTNFTVTC